MEGNEIEVRATINLPGLKHGRTAFVNPDEPYVRMCLDTGKIVQVHLDGESRRVESGDNG